MPNLRPARRSPRVAEPYVLLALRRVDLGRQQDGQHGGEHEQAEGVAQHPLRADLGQQQRHRGRDGGRGGSGQAEPRVRLDQGEALGHEPGHGRRLGHAVRLRRHQHAECGQEKGRGLPGDSAGQHPAAEAADRHRRSQRPPPAATEAVEERADERRHHGEGQHREQQELGDLTARVAGRNLEEQGAGQSDGDGGVTGGADGVHLHQPGQTRLACALGMGHAPGTAHRAAGQPAGRAGGPHRAGAARAARAAERPSRRSRPARRRRPAALAYVPGTPQSCPTARTRSVTLPAVWKDQVVTTDPATSRAARARPDAVLARAVDEARAAAVEVAGPSNVGDHTGARSEGDRVVTHLFRCTQPGYRGWHWSVTLARAPRQRHITVDEVVLLPGDDALVAPPGCRGPSGCSPATSGRATCSRSTTTTRGWCPGGLPATRRPRPWWTSRQCARSPTRSASAAKGCSRSRAGTRPPPGGTTATTDRPRPWPRPRPRAAPAAVSWSAWPAHSAPCSACAPTAWSATTAAS